ncbi:MAG: ABC transporter permease [Ilumatobacteraceae bacterium]
MLAADAEQETLVRRRARARRKRRRFPIVPVAVWVVVLACALFSPLLAPDSPTEQTLTARLKPPFFLHGGSTSHLLGTDNLGRDVLSRLIYGARVTVIVAVLAVTLSAAIGTIIGLIAGYYGKWVDTLLMRIVDFQVALPALLFGVMVATTTKPGLRNVIVIIVLFTWAPFARLVRAEALALRDREFVQLAKVANLRGWKVMLKHVFPNVLSTAMVLATLNLSVVILFEAALSFLGLGIMPPSVSWGLMLSDGRQYLTVAWWLVTWPGIAIVAVALSGNLFGDWLRDRLDPHLVHGR